LPSGSVATTATSELDPRLDEQTANAADAVPGLSANLANAAAGFVALQEVSTNVIALGSGQALARLELGWLRHSQILLPMRPAPPVP
jgi:hypothetical protein